VESIRRAFWPVRPSRRVWRSFDGHAMFGIKQKGRPKPPK
jgi:hypothetical protein